MCRYCREDINYIRIFLIAVTGNTNDDVMNRGVQDREASCKHVRRISSKKALANKKFLSKCGGGSC